MPLQILSLKRDGITAGDYLMWCRDPEPSALDFALRSVSVDADLLGDTITAILDWNGPRPGGWPPSGYHMGDRVGHTADDRERERAPHPSRNAEPLARARRGNGIRIMAMIATGLDRHPGRERQNLAEAFSRGFSSAARSSLPPTSVLID